ncbi:MAG: DNA cytosine methyltransferase [Planctomycetaceae bacterium]|nr:DNA cytosine methyltransferase [Planctomycetaceae bacterium]
MTTLLPGLIDRQTAYDVGADTELIIDNFAGAGGASLGIEKAMGRSVDIAVNHSALMLRMHEVNHPHTRHLCEDVWHVNPLEQTGGRPVGLAWFSPDCKHHSKAKGGVPLEKGIRGLAWVAVRWAIEARPRVIILENVEEFAKWGPLVQKKHPNGRPVWTVDPRTGKKKPHLVADKARAGEYFRAFIAALGDGMLPSLELVDELQEFWGGKAPLFRLMKGCGYKVEFRELVAADYGVPTTRKRFFMIARCDGQPVRWPARTHAPRHKAAAMGLLPWRSAAECIEWSRPCPSIFERKRPLADATMRRIARGIYKYVIAADEPFIVTCNHAGDSGGLRSAAEPMRTVTGARDANGVVSPTLVHCAHGEESASGKRWGKGEHTVEEPIGTLTASKDYALASASLISIANYNGSTPAADASNPLSTVTAWPRGGHHALVESFLTKYHGERKGDASGRSCNPAEPIKTCDTQNRFGLVSTFLAKHYGGVTGQELEKPIGTVTSVDHHSLVSASLVGPTLQPAQYTHKCEAQSGLTIVSASRAKCRRCGLYPESCIAAASLIGAGGPAYSGKPTDPAEPVGTIMPENHRALVSASLVGVGGRAGQSPERGADDPLHTVTAKGDTAIAAASLVKHYGTSQHGQDVAEPMPVITGGGNHVSEVRAFMVKYYSSGGQDQSLASPLHTLTDRARMGLVEVKGILHQIVDIGLRMLEPCELLIAQFGRFAKEYVLMGTKAQQVAAIGNSVPPELAEAIVRANFQSATAENAEVQK